MGSAKCLNCRNSEDQNRDGMAVVLKQTEILVSVRELGVLLASVCNSVNKQATKYTFIT